MKAAGKRHHLRLEDHRSSSLTAARNAAGIATWLIKIHSSPKNIGTPYKRTHKRKGAVKRLSLRPLPAPAQPEISGVSAGGWPTFHRGARRSSRAAMQCQSVLLILEHD